MQQKRVLNRSVWCGKSNFPNTKVSTCAVEFSSARKHSTMEEEQGARSARRLGVLAHHGIMRGGALVCFTLSLYLVKIDDGNWRSCNNNNHNHKSIPRLIAYLERFVRLKRYCKAIHGIIEVSYKIKTRTHWQRRGREQLSIPISSWFIWREVSNMFNSRWERYIQLSKVMRYLIAVFFSN